ncbi:MAG: Circadian clock protein kinase KaiC [Verrucomicrobiota bacterium]|jgi:circadian clock protein KaiC
MKSTQVSGALELAKARTYVSGLDDVLNGGLPSGRTTCINGMAGSGKTLLGLEFLYRGALNGEPGIFIGFEESIRQICENAATMGWDLEALQRENRLFLMDSRLTPDILRSGDFSLKGLLAVVSGKQREMKATRVVFDALEVALRLFDTSQQVRNEMHVLNDWLHSAGMTSILTLRQRANQEASAYEEFFDSMADCLIRMTTRTVDQSAISRLQVVKYRGSAFGRNEIPYIIGEGGIRLAPISTVGLRHKRPGDRLSSGLSRLNKMLGGGYQRGSCILIAGLPGTGKTILASTFAAETSVRGESVIYIGFEESETAVVGNVLSAGVNLSPHTESGLLRFLTGFPEAMGAEEHYFRALEGIQAAGAKHVVVDAISACRRMGGEQAAYEYLMRLLNACKEKGITIILINQTSSDGEFLGLSGNNISSMVDTMLHLQYQQCPGETNRVIQILKSRGSSHSNLKHEFAITGEGIRILDAYIGEGDVLTGSLRGRQEMKDQFAAQRLAYDIEFKELELKLMRLNQEGAKQARAQRSVNWNSLDAPVEANPDTSSGMQEE